MALNRTLHASSVRCPISSSVYNPSALRVTRETGTSTLLRLSPLCVLAQVSEQCWETVWACTASTTSSEGAAAAFVLVVTGIRFGQILARVEKMMADSAKMREDYAKAIVLNSEISIDEVTLAQAAKYDDALAKRAAMKARSMESQYKSEKEKRMRREEDLRIAEARIADLESTIKELEDLVDDKPKRSLPDPTQSDWLPRDTG
jgi:hypothetical protein